MKSNGNYFDYGNRKIENQIFTHSMRCTNSDPLTRSLLTDNTLLNFKGLPPRFEFVKESEKFSLLNEMDSVKIQFQYKLVAFDSSSTFHLQSRKRLDA